MPCDSLLITLSAQLCYECSCVLAQLWQELLSRPYRGPLDHRDGPVRFSLQCGCIQSQQLSTPPHPRRAFFGHCREPVLPEYRADLSRWFLRKRIAGKECQHILVIGKEPELRVRHNRILAPGTQRREPKVPIEPRLIRRVDPGRFIHVLRLEAKRVSHPVLAIWRTLEFDLVSAARHHREEPVLISYPEWLKRGYRGRW